MTKKTEPKPNVKVEWFTRGIIFVGLCYLLGVIIGVTTGITTSNPADLLTGGLIVGFILGALSHRMIKFLKRNRP